MSCPRSLSQPANAGTVMAGRCADRHYVRMLDMTGPEDRRAVADPIRVALLNDYEIVLAGIAQILAAYPQRVRVVELDANTPVLNDVDIVLYDTFAQAQADALDLTVLPTDYAGKLVIFSWNNDAELTSAAVAAGATGYLSKGINAEQLVTALEQVHAGEHVHLATEGDHFGRWPGDSLGLSARESEVLALICQGLSNKQICQRAFLGMNTVKTYIRTLYRKIGVSTRTQAVLFGIDHGFAPDHRRITL